MKLKTVFFIFIAMLSIWFLFVERTILTPFIIAAIFSYLLTPVVNFFEQKLNVHRIVGVLLTYILLLVPIVIIGILLSRTIRLESLDLDQVLNSLLANASSEVTNLPEWLRPITRDLLINLQRSRFIRQIDAPNLELVFSQAISRVISVFIFIFSSFYFLKDGQTFTQRLVDFLPTKYKVDIDLLLKKINLVLAGYLRGQVFLIFFVSVMLYIAFLILGVRFALTLALFSGFAEIVPVIGPITAGAIAIMVVLFTGTANFGLSPIVAAAIIAFMYFIFRQLEDYLIIPIVMERNTKLPPFFVFFAVIAGGHLAGILGLILAVPTAAILKLLLEFSMDKLNDR